MVWRTEPLIAESARQHGIADDDMLNAFRNAFDLFERDEEFTMFIGGARSGQLLEVGVVDSDEGPVIVHAMKARDKFLRQRR